MARYMATSADLVDDPLGITRCVRLHIIATGQRDEFVTTDTGDELAFPRHPGQPLPQLAQDGITCRVPMHVVDFLEPVEIEGQHGDPGIAVVESIR